MQRRVQEIELPPGPALFLIEDETGSGKTEGALMLAHRLMASKAADGLYVALPTMATSNAMFDRLAHSYRALFAKSTQPSIALAHGARDMHQGFRAAMLRRCQNGKTLLRVGLRPRPKHSHRISSVCRVGRRRQATGVSGRHWGWHAGPSALVRAANKAPITCGFWG